MTPEEQDEDRIAKIRRCASRHQLRDMIAGMIYADDVGAQPYTANQKAEAAKKMMQLEKRRR